jgi:putative hydrolase of the HAD superfamily
MSASTTPIQAEYGPDFRHVRCWLFDLDNTLYSANSGVFARIDARMTEFIASYLGLSGEKAREVQKALYREHGTTLNGLMKVYHLDPEPYLDFVHRIDLSDLGEDKALARAIAGLPGRRCVFTNGCARHAARILDRLGMAHLFDDIWDIRSIGFVPKPDPVAYRRIAAHFRAEEAAMFDDIARNLVEAHVMGMTTIWLNARSVWERQGPEFPVALPAHIDHEISDLTEFLTHIRI